MAKVVECTLPSAQSACRLVQGDVSALPVVAGHMLGRAAIIGVGCYLAGFRSRDLVVASLSGAAAIELAVLLFTSEQVRRAEATPASVRGVCGC